MLYTLLTSKNISYLHICVNYKESMRRPSSSTNTVILFSNKPFIFPVQIVKMREESKPFAFKELVPM